jgi:hypothetical protein
MLIKNWLAVKGQMCTFLPILFFNKISDKSIIHSVSQKKKKKSYDLFGTQPSNCNVQNIP